MEEPASNDVGTAGSAMPRVTLVLVAFNQERFIDAAVSSALGQDYSNLEIILSDDNSTDSTFARMQALADAYTGPHAVLLNRSPGGRGLLAHLYHAVARASGRLIVAAAGDDISYPHRVSRLVASWRESGASALISGYDRIAEDGRHLGRFVGAPVASEYDPSAYFEQGKVQQVVGYCAAYDRRLFEAVELPDEPIMAEDYFFSLVLGLRSMPVEYVPEALLAYRVHDQAITHVGAVSVEAYEAKSAYTAQMFGSVLRLVSGKGGRPLRIDAEWGTPARVDRRRLERDIAYLQHRAGWLESSWLERLAALFRFRARHQLRWMLPRLVGIRLFAAVKRRLQRGP